MSIPAAIVTGASRGIGAATALRLAEEGFAVVVNYLRSAEAAAEAVRSIKDAGGLAVPFKADVSDAAEAAALVDVCLREFGPPKVLVNNAGISQSSLFCDLSPEDWRRMLDVHVTGAYNTIRAAAPHMVSAGRGAIVNVSSVWGVYGGSCEAHYSAAKSALIGLTKALARELGPSGVRVNCVAPGVIETDMLAEYTEADLRSLSEATPLCRIGTPAEAAEAIAFLASERASFITGQVLGVDGGFVG